jgi:hypothetical protein
MLARCIRNTPSQTSVTADASAFVAAVAVPVPPMTRAHDANIAASAALCEILNMTEK